jgi:hypothetical protein
MNNYSYKSKSSSDQYEVLYNGKIKLKRLSLINYDAGCTYYMKSQELHRIINPEKLETITLMMTGLPVDKLVNCIQNCSLKKKTVHVNLYKE